MRKEIVIAGSGGQGVQSLGGILAKALDSKGFFVSLKSSYGSAVRGGDSFSQVVVKESPEDWSEVLMPDILVAMSQEGYDTWISKISSESEVFFENSLVKTATVPNIWQRPVNAIEVANKLGSRIAANMVMLGAIVAITELCSLEDLSSVVRRELGKFADTNLKAVEEGYKLGRAYSGTN